MLTSKLSKLIVIRLFGMIIHIIIYIYVKFGFGNIISSQCTRLPLTALFVTQGEKFVVNFMWGFPKEIS